MLEVTGRFEAERKSGPVDRELANFVDNSRILHGNVTMESRSFFVENDIDAGKGIGGKIPINLLIIVRFVFAQEIIEIQYNERNASYIAFTFVGLHLALTPPYIRVTNTAVRSLPHAIACQGVGGWLPTAASHPVGLTAMHATPYWPLRPFRPSARHGHAYYAVG